MNRLLKFFSYSHLPQHLQGASKPFYDLAMKIGEELPESPEKTVCLRKLLEAKDCAVRATMEVSDATATPR
jgi:ferritin-like protein